MVQIARRATVSLLATRPIGAAPQSPIINRRHILHKMLKAQEKRAIRAKQAAQWDRQNPGQEAQNPFARREAPLEAVRQEAKKAFTSYAESWKTRLPILQHVPLEHSFYTVRNGMRIWKGHTPGTTHRKEPALVDHWQGEPVTRLSLRARAIHGRDHTGKLVNRGRGGGGSREVRIVDFHRALPGACEIVRLEKDPLRSSTLALVRHTQTNEFSYITAFEGAARGTRIYSFIRDDAMDLAREELGREPDSLWLFRPGNAFRLRDIPLNTVVHNVGLWEGGHAQLCRAAGTYARLTALDENWATLQLASKEIRRVPVNAIATIGKVGNLEHHLTNLGKAGAARNMGRRPKVHGAAMNPNDHPHGGMRRRKSNRQPRSRTGVLKFVRTRAKRHRNQLVVVPRWHAKK